jgi:hypothetical protein
VTGLLHADGKKDIWGFGVQPICGYDNDADWTVGGSGVIYYNSNPSDSSQELDELNLTTSYSFNGGNNFNIELTKFINGNNQFLTLGLGREKTFNDFYGTGSNAVGQVKEHYTAVDILCNLSYSVNVLPHLFVSAGYDFHYLDVRGEGAGGEALTPQLRESDDTHCSGIGMALEYRTTNPGLYKRSGQRISLSGLWYLHALYSSSAFEFGDLTYRCYFPLFSHSVLGLHFRAETTHGDVPVNYLPCLGGNKLVRGFKTNRYKARHSIAGQTEFRFPVWWRFGGTVFLGAGETADALREFNSRIDAAGGVGLRFAVQKKQNINIRFDIAFNSDGDVVKYFKLKEAF